MVPVRIRAVWKKPVAVVGECVISCPNSRTDCGISLIFPPIRTPRILARLRVQLTYWTLSRSASPTNCLFSISIQRRQGKRCDGLKGGSKAMLRRTFMALLGSAAACPIAADAQQGGSPKRIGFIAGGVRPTPFEGSLYDAFPQGMRALGYVEGKDFVVEWRFANGKYERFPEFAKEMVDLKVDAIVLGAMAAVRPTQVVTSSIPIIMGNSIDPVRNGLVASLSHPGGNTTGLSSAYEEIIPKLIETLAIVVPQLSRVGMFINPNNPIHASNLKFSDA